MRDRRRDPAGRRGTRRRGRRPHHRGHAPTWAGRHGSARRGSDRAGPPPSQDHRPVRARRPADGRLRPGAGRRVQRLHLQLPGAARRAGGRGLPLLLPLRHRGDRSRRSTAGARRASSASTACSRSPSPSATPACSSLGRDRLGIKPLYLSETPDRLRFASTLPALLEGGDVDTSIDRVALHHYMTFHSRRPGAAHDPARASASCRRPRSARSSPTASAPRHVYWRPDVRPPTSRPELGERDWRDAVLEALRVARRSAGWSPTCPSGCCCPAASTPRWSSPCSPRQGQRGLKTFSIGFDAARRRERRRVRVLRPDRRALRHRPPADPDRPPTACCPPSTTPIAAMSRADGQPRLRGLLPALRGGRQVGQGRAVRPGRRRGVRAATAGTRRWPTCRATARVRRLRAGVLRPPARRPGEHRSSPSGCCPTTRAATFVAEHFAAPGAADRARRGAAHRLDDHAGRRPGQAGGQHDDGVGAGGPGAVPRPRAGRAGRRLPARSSSSRTAARVCSRRRRAASCRTR